jgi:hypothetical protein
MKFPVASFIAIVILLGFGNQIAYANSLEKNPRNLSEANQIILLLQKQIELLQAQLNEQREVTKKAVATVYYASISTELVESKSKECFVITISEKDGTLAVNSELNILVQDRNTAVASLRKGKVFTLTTDEYGKAYYCGAATKITVKKSGLLKQDKAFDTRGMIDKKTYKDSNSTNVEKLPVEKSKSTCSPAGYGNSTRPPVCS